VTDEEHRPSRMLARRSPGESAEVGDEIGEALDVGPRTRRPAVAAMVQRVHRIALVHQSRGDVTVAGTVFAESMRYHDHRARFVLGQPALGIQVELSAAGRLGFSMLHVAHLSLVGLAGVAIARTMCP